VHTLLQRPLAASSAAGLVLALAALAIQVPAQAQHAAAAHPSAQQSRTAGYISGKLVDPATGKPVKGVTVRVFRINTDTLLGSDKSGSLGRFKVDGLSAADEELDVRANGRAVDYETGWFSCSHTIVQSWGAACSQGQGWQGVFKIQHL
jgi:hypothetical protein